MTTNPPLEEATTTPPPAASSANRGENGGGRESTDVVTWLRNKLEDSDPELLRQMLGRFVQLLMAAEAQSLCEADSGRWARGRVNSRNAYRRLLWDTPVGSISLAIPKLSKGHYSPEWLLEPRRGNSQQRAERAIEALMDTCLAGVSTHRAELAIKAIGVETISKSQLAILGKSLNKLVADFRKRPLDGGPYPYLSIDTRTRCSGEASRGLHSMTVIATGVHHNGKRAILGLDVLTSDDRSAWTRFLRGLVTGGLSGVRLVVADSHPGLKDAVAEILPGTVCQRCPVGVLRDLLTPVPGPAQSMVATLVGSIYAQPGRAAAAAQHKRIVAQLHERFPETAGILAEAGPEMLAFTSFPKRHWSQIWSRDQRDFLNGRDGVGIRHHHPNFFVLAAGDQSMPRYAGNGALGAEKVNGEVSTATRMLAAASRLPVAANSRFVTPSVVVVLAAGFLAHALNVFNFPRYELDEGTYLSSAWAILNGQVTAYPYGYGHPPFGWMQIAAWVQLTGGFFTFGSALNTGRVLMLFYALGSSCLIYLIGHRLSGRRIIGLLAVVIFSFSPLSLHYQRQVYLDNIGVFWLLLSLYLIVAGRSRLSHIVPAGLAFGLALLSKEVFVVFLPVMIFAVWLHTTRYQHLFGLITFTYSVVSLGSAFILMAVLKGELLPYAWHLPWDHHQHLSLLDTFSRQIQRAESEGRFSDSWYTWTHADAPLIFIGVAATAFNLVAGLWNRKQLILPLAALSYWALLLRGGVVLAFYVIVLIPLIALNAAFALHTITNWVRKLVRVELVVTLLIVGIAGTVLVNDVQQSGPAFTQKPTAAQTQSMIWIRNHVPHDSVVVINSYLYMDLRQPGGEGVGDGATYPYAHVYWNIAYDPELHDGLLQNNWDRIDYIVADSEMQHDVNTLGGPMLLVATAMNHSVLRAEFRADDHGKQIVISIYQVMHNQPAPLGVPATPDAGNGGGTA